MSELTKHNEIARGNAAHRLLEDVAFNDAMSELQADLKQQIVGSNPNDRDGREDSYRLHRCVDMLRDKLVAWAAAADFYKLRDEINQKPSIG